ncbi:class I SAM-dependent methyltransferase [Methanosphaerula palustris]|uniref:Methyltransferase type 11 n=1 Tax=Methanosphaerula palustris (strain ATCC BAA-1556 / DSM 19958 / E1-9c) TaxID=521011 RepID=B8GHY6_METPE|nr:class I SAM-dependent methyltransferase [Methanosphaerula palustris]ACL16726.1 Methyltransferase type 11 [Methanosphaerula palustris E1-9c]
MVSNNRRHDVFPAKKASILDIRLRWFLYRPDRLAEMYVNPGDRVLDVGCGPGFFTREFARRVGEKGQVCAVDLQEEMLAILRGKLEPEGLMRRIQVHHCRPDSLDLPPEMNGTFDAAFTMFVVHEVPSPAKLFQEIARLLKPGGILYSTEPVIVSGKEFQEYVVCAEEAGFQQIDRSFYFVHRAVVMKKQ